MSLTYEHKHPFHSYCFGHLYLYRVYIIFRFTMVPILVKSVLKVWIRILPGSLLKTLVKDTYSKGIYTYIYEKP